MKLYVNLAASNISSALVRSETSLVPVRMQDLVLADILALEVTLVDGAGAVDPSSGATGYSIKAAVGIPGQPAVALQTTFTDAGSSWTGAVNLATVPFSNLLDGARSVEGFFEIELSDPTGNRRTIAQAPVILRNEIVAEDSLTPDVLPDYYTAVESEAKFVQNRSGLTDLTGGGATKLDGIATVNLPAGIMVVVHKLPGTHEALLYQLFAGTAAESSPTIILPDDYNATANAKHWKLQSLTVDKLTANSIAASAIEASQVFAAATPPLDDDELTRKDYVDAGDAANAAAAATAYSTALIAESDAQSALTSKVNRSGDTMTGSLVLAADPANPLEAATKQYVDGKVAKSGDTMTGALTVQAAITADQLVLTQSALTYAATTDIDFDLKSFRTLALTGNVTFTTSHRGAGKTVSLKIAADSSTRNFTFPAGWVFVGNAAPGSIAANKTAILTLTCFGATDSDIVAAYAVQP